MSVPEELNKIIYEINRLKQYLNLTDPTNRGHYYLSTAIIELREAAYFIDNEGGG